MSQELAAIVERYNKMKILVPEGQVHLYQVMRDDIRALLKIVDMQQRQINDLMPKEVA